VPRREVDGIFIRAAINRRQEGSVDRVGRDLKYRAKKIDERSRGRCLHARLHARCARASIEIAPRGARLIAGGWKMRFDRIGMDSTFAANPRQERFQDRGMTREDRSPRAFPRKRGQPFLEPRD